MKTDKPPRTCLELEGMYIGARKCPQCGRRYQKDVRMIYTPDVKTFSHILCSWCLVVLVAKCAKAGVDLRFKWFGLNEKKKYDSWKRNDPPLEWHPDLLKKKESP